MVLIGSALSGATQTIGQLIAFRAFQGLGAAALQPIAIAIIGDLFAPRERGKWQGVSGSIYALAAIIGPLAGGWITDHASWRWVFYVNLPVGVLALLVLIFLMPPLRSTSKIVSIDYIGAAHPGYCTIVAWLHTCRIAICMAVSTSSRFVWECGNSVNRAGYVCQAIGTSGKRASF